jgi:hypothetical protein
VFKIWDGAAWRSEAGEFVNATGDTMTGDLVMNNANLVFEGSVDDGFETTLTVVNPTADRTITLPNVTGTVVTTGDSGTVTSTMIADGTIVNADVNASAAIAGTKISPDFGSQTIQTTGIVSHALGSASAPTVTFTGDTNTGIYSPGADQVAISTNGSGRLFVGSTGNVGVGTTSPSALLHVAGNTRIGANDASNVELEIGAGATGNRTVYIDLIGDTTYNDYGLRVIRNGGPNNNSNVRHRGTGEFALIAEEAAPITFYTSLSERMRLDSSGRLGLGTSAPQSLLHVKTASQFDVVDADGTAGIFIEQSGGTAASGAYSTALTLSKINSGRPGAAVAAVQTSADDDQLGLAFLTHSSALSNDTLSEAMRITHAGLVGIGTTSPAYPLHVEGTGATPGRIYLGNSLEGLATGVNNGGAIYFGLNPTSATTPTAGIEASWGGSTNPQIHFGITRDGNKTRISAFSDSTIRMYTASASERVRIDSTGTFNILANSSTAPFLANIGGSEVARIDSSGRLLVGTSTARSNFFNSTVSSAVHIESASGNGRFISLVNSGAGGGSGGGIILGSSAGSNGLAVGELGIISFQGNDGTEFVEGARIEAFVDGTSSANDMPSRLVFSTTADGASSPTERMRIRNNGDIVLRNVATTDVTSGAVTGKFFTGDSNILESARSETADVAHVRFYNANGNIGSIRTSGSATSFNTSSDYRLKENVVPLTGAVDRLNQLQVHRFNFIADPDKTVDGFIAHEAQAVVPECVTGTKDEVDADGNPVYQGIDQSKLVPLLTAALQEALAEIESLKARLTAAGL